MVQTQNAISLAQRAGRNLDHELWTRRIKQVDFALQVNRNTRTIRRWIYEGIPSLADLELIVNTLHISLWDILSDKKDVPSHYLLKSA